jgi:hypothetical protein
MKALVPLLTFVLSIGVFLLWLIITLRRRRSACDIEVAQKPSYSVIHVLGMIGICLLLIPIFMIVLLNLWKPIRFLMGWVLYSLNAPQQIVIPIGILFEIFALATSFIGTFILCRLIWGELRTWELGGTRQ